jgi:hypothetical protein
VNEDNTDHFWQITYIGVPLTVAGVLPLLWNMFMAIHIWLKLKRSIPLGYREYYSLLPDPAAGKVTVVARTPSLERPGLWPTKAGGYGLRKPLLPKPKTALPSLADHVAFVPIAPALSGLTASKLTVNDGNITVPFRSFKMPRRTLLGRTWMTLADRCALVLGSPEDDENAYETKLERDEEDEIRFSVESDMNANAPTPLRMDWAQFVWFSLALGVPPYNSEWCGSYPCTLKDIEGNALITLFESEGQFFARLFTERNISYSLNRAFAWHNVILEREGLWPLGWQRKSHVPLSSVQISPGLSTLLNTNELERGASSVLRGKEAQDCEDPLASACRWMLYHRRYRSITRVSIPVSQQMMEFRERALCHLHLLDKKGQLEEKIRLLVRAALEPKDPVRTSDEKMANNDSQGTLEPRTTGLNDVSDEVNATVTFADASHETNKHTSVEAEQSELDQRAIDVQTIDERESTPCDITPDQANFFGSATQVEPVSPIDPDDAQADRDCTDGHDGHPQHPTATNPRSASPIASSRNGPAKGGLPTHVNTENRKVKSEPATQLSASQSKTVSTILDAIRSVLAASNYVKRFETLLSIRSEIVHRFVKLSGSRARLKALYKFQPRGTANAIEDDAIFGPALAWLAKFRAECNELDTLTDHKSRRSKTIDVYELLPRIHRARLEDATLEGTSAPSVLSSNSSDNTSFVALIALAAAEWDTDINQAWRLNTEVLNRFEALTTTWREEALRFGHDQKKRLDSQRKVQLDTELQTTDLINDGLYNAPENSELDILLTKEIRKVCLL